MNPDIELVLRTQPLSHVTAMQMVDESNVITYDDSFMYVERQDGTLIIKVRAVALMQAMGLTK